MKLLNKNTAKAIYQRYTAGIKDFSIGDYSYHFHNANSKFGDYYIRYWKTSAYPEIIYLSWVKDSLEG